MSEAPKSAPARRRVIDGKYELLEEIGRGGMGMVWKAHVKTLEIDCAIKFILPVAAQDAAMRARFFREARLAARLQSPYTVNILDVGEWEGHPFIAMELLRGQSLEALLQKNRVLSPELTCSIVQQIALGLSKAHAAQLVHRDLKPDNIFIVEREPLHLKILDFGIAKQVDAVTDVHTVAGAIVGTPYYMSPEQFAGGANIDQRVDIWALSVVAFQCLTGSRPYDADSLTSIILKIVSERPPNPRSINPSLPEAVDAWWMRATNRDRSLRPDSALTCARELQEALFGVTSGAERLGTGTLPMEPGTFKPVSTLEPPAPPARPGRAARTGRVLLAGLLAAAAIGTALGVGGLLYWKSSTPEATPSASPETLTASRPSDVEQRPAPIVIAEAATPPASSSVAPSAPPAAPPAQNTPPAPPRRETPAPTEKKSNTVTSPPKGGRDVVPPRAPRKEDLNERLGF